MHDILSTHVVLSSLVSAVSSHVKCCTESQKKRSSRRSSRVSQREKLSISCCCIWDFFFNCWNYYFVPFSREMSAWPHNMRKVLDIFPCSSTMIWCEIWCLRLRQWERNERLKIFLQESKRYETSLRVPKIDCRLIEQWHTRKRENFLIKISVQFLTSC